MTKRRSKLMVAAKAQRRIHRGETLLAELEREMAAKPGYAVSPHGSVWMTDDISAARAVAVDAMRALGIDECDWRTRDKIILAISDRINGMLDYAQFPQTFPCRREG